MYAYTVICTYIYGRMPICWLADVYLSDLLCTVSRVFAFFRVVFLSFPKPKTDRLWNHEINRTFRDGLAREEDRLALDGLVKNQLMLRHFDPALLKALRNPHSLLFTHLSSTRGTNSSVLPDYNNSRRYRPIEADSQELEALCNRYVLSGLLLASVLSLSSFRAKSFFIQM